MPDLNGRAVLLITIGSIAAYAGLKGKGIGTVTRDFITGQNPSSSPVQTSISTPTIGTGDGSISSTDSVPPVTGNPTGNRALGKLMAAGYGWTGSQWNALDQLWTRESSWNNTADNPSSHAYGIAQALPASKYPLAGQPPSAGGTSSASVQIAWGLSYIKARYGSPAVAWQHELANSWY